MPVATVDHEHRVTPRELFSDLVFALVTGSRRTASVTTRTPVHLLVFKAPPFRALLS